MYILLVQIVNRAHLKASL